MSLGELDPDYIWLAWDGDSRAVLGYCPRAGTKAQSAEAIVLCHPQSPAATPQRRSGSVVDLFAIHSAKDFRRPLRLPRGTHSVEILLRGQGAAVPLKTFILLQSTAHQQGELRIGTIFLTLPSTRCQFFWSSAAGYHFRDQRNIGWAAQFACWSADDRQSPGAVVTVSKVTLIVPHSEQTIRLVEGPYEYLEPLDTIPNPGVPAIRAACAEAKRVSSVSIQIQGISHQQLQSLFLIHVCAHRMKARDWKDMLAIDEKVFAQIVAPLVERYEDALHQQGWEEDVADKAATEMQDFMTGYYRWRSLAEANSQVDIEPISRGIVVHIYNASAGDHLVFYDALGRTFSPTTTNSPTATKRPNSIAAFCVGDEKLERLDGVYDESHPLVVEVFAEKPNLEYDDVMGSELSLKPDMRRWMDESGLKPTPSHIAPLLADAARIAGLPRAIVERDLLHLEFDGAAWLLAHACDPASPGKPLRSPRSPDGDVVSRAMYMLGAANALKAHPTLESQIAVAFALLRHAGTSALATCLARLDEVDLATANLEELAGTVLEADQLMAKPDFADWLRAENEAVYSAFRNASGMPARVAVGDLPARMSELREAVAGFDDYQKDYRELTEGGEPSQTSAPAAEPLPEVDSLIAALARIDAPAAERYRRFLATHAANAYVSARIAATIRARYPRLEPAGNEELARVLRGLENRAGANLRRNLIETLAGSARFYQHDTAEGPTAAAERTREEVADIVAATAHDKKVKEALPSLAAAAAMHRMHGAIEKLIATARRESIVVPAKELRALMVWPRESNATWQQFVAFERQHAGKLGGALSRLDAELSGNTTTNGPATVRVDVAPPRSARGRRTRK